MTRRPQIIGSNGMVSTTHPAASAAGMASIASGGNAFDAAVVAGLVLSVVEPHLNGIGGEVPILVGEAGKVDVSVIAGQGPAPKQASLVHFRELGIERIPGNGFLPACVPAAFDAWMALLKNWGTQSLEEVFEIPIRLALGGFPVVKRLADRLEGFESTLRNDWPTSGEVFLINGKAPREGGRLTNLQLGELYQRIVRESIVDNRSRDQSIERARNLFYQGFVAEAVDSFYSREAILDSTGNRNRGLLTGEDLARFEVPIERAASRNFRGYDVHKTGPWGQGPVMLQQLALADAVGLDLASMDDPASDHMLIEMLKLAFADREAWYGDPRHVDVPLEHLLSDAYADARVRLLGDKAVGELRPGSPGGRTPILPDGALMSTPGDGPNPWERVGVRGMGEAPPSAPPERPGDTVYIAVADASGNVVSATPSGGWVQGAPVVPGLGFPIGTRGQAFWLQEGLPNSLAGSKRPRTTLTPTLVTDDSGPVLAVGTPGGDCQDQWTTLALLRWTTGLSMQEAIERPMFHSAHFPSSFNPRTRMPTTVFAERDIGPARLEALRGRGHDVRLVEEQSIGRNCAVGVDRVNGLLWGAATPRGNQAYAVGY